MVFSVKKAIEQKKNGGGYRVLLRKSEEITGGKDSETSTGTPSPKENPYGVGQNDDWDDRCKNPYTRDHSHRVRRISAEIGIAKRFQPHRGK